MKKIISILVCFLLAWGTYAQEKENPTNGNNIEIITKEKEPIKETKEERRQRYINEGNPFKEFGYTPRIITLSNGKYKEFFTDSIITIGNFVYNRDTKQVTGVKIIEELGISEATLKPDIVSRWMSPDPLSSEFPEWSPYNFVMNNPIRYIDPEGLAPFDIIGVTKDDAKKFKTDIHTVLGDSKFDNLRSLIDIKGKKFKKIDTEALTTALDGVTLSADEQTYVDIVVNAINSDDVHKVEFLTGAFTSSEGATAFKEHMNNAQAGVGDAMLTPEGKLSSGIVKAHGDGLNVPTKKGSHSFITNTTANKDRAVTSSHEVFGHGIPSAKGLTPAQNNANAIRTDNLVRRILGLPQRDGSKHGGFKEGHITDPQKLPIKN